MTLDLEETMMATIRTPDEITDVEVARAAWIARGEHDPVNRAVALLSPLTAFDWLIQPEDTPERRAWREGEQLQRLRSRVQATLESYRTYTTPAVLASHVGRELIERLAALCYRHGIPSWDQVVAVLDAYPHVRDLAETLGYPDSLSLAEIVPAVDAAWWEIARRVDA